MAVALSQVFVNGQLNMYFSNFPTASCHVRGENLQLYLKMIQAIRKLVLLPFHSFLINKGLPFTERAFDLESWSFISKEQC